MKQKKIIAGFVFYLITFAQPAAAIESICPGGSSPRADIIWCADFETPCADDSSDTCWTDNGFTSRSDHRGSDMRILTDAGRAVLGSRYALLKGIIGGTGTGYASYNPSPSLSEVRIRWYQRFNKYLHYYHNHFAGVSVDKAGPTTPCHRGATLEMGGQSSVYNYGSGTCGYTSGGGFDLDMHPNQGIAPVLKNGKWYRFELAIKLDTSCSAETAHACNGVYKLWIDGNLVISYTDVNWGGAINSALITVLDIVRNYYHYRNPQEAGEVWFDQLVVGNDADTEIGAATGATNIGTEVADAYGITCGIEGFYLSSSVSYSPELDFAAAPGSRISVCGSPAETWRGNAGVGSTTIYHTGVVTDHASGGGRPYAEQSLKSECTGANCGAGVRSPRMGGLVSGSEGDGNSNVYRNGVLPQQVDHGYIYFPSTSTPNDKIAYNGFYGKGTDWHSNYIGLSENAGKLAIIQRHNDGTPGYVVTSDVDIVRDTWHRYELIVWDSEGFSLMFDGVQLYDQEPLTNSPTWLFDSAHTADDSGSVTGIIDYIGSGTVAIYHDDISKGTVSFWNCDGWDATMCPFAASANIGGIFPWLL